MIIYIFNMAFRLVLLALLLCYVSYGFWQECVTNFISAASARNAELIGDYHYVHLGTLKVIFTEKEYVFLTLTMICIVFRHAPSLTVSYVTLAIQTAFKCSQIVVNSTRTTFHSLLGLRAKATFNIRNGRRQACTIAFALLLASGDVKPNPGPALGSPKQQPTQRAYSNISFHTLQYIDVLGDGHCFIHALKISLHHFIDLDISYDSLCKSLQDELQSNYDKYSPFTRCTLIKYRRQVTEYFVYKRYNSDLVDCLPLAAANALCVRIFIIADHSTNVDNCA